MPAQARSLARQAAGSQANAAGSGRRHGVYAALGRQPAVDAEDYVDAVYMVLAAAARTHHSTKD